jgi:UbiD family decarboxylase
MSLRDFVKKLDKELVIIDKPVSIKYEAAAIIKKLDGRPVLFKKIKESNLPVIANVCSTRELVAKAFCCKKSEIIEKMVDAIDNPKKIELSKNNYNEIENDLTKLPILVHYGEDGGPYISSAIVVAKDKELGINSSFHRMMVIEKNAVAARILPRHLQEFINRGDKEVAICIGPDIQVLIASAISCELGKSELEIANAFKKTSFSEVEGHVVPDSEIVMIAEVTDELHDEGKFIDLTGTYDIVRQQPVIKIKKIYAKKNAIYHALLPGGLEHKTLMGMPREPTIFREVNKHCECKDVFLSIGGCSWLHGIVQIKKKNSDDGKKSIEAAFAGHKSMKHVIIVDDDIDIYDPVSVEWALATRVQGDRDVIIKPNEKGSSLDPSADPKTYKTCKIGIDATIPANSDKKDFTKNVIPGEEKIDVTKLVKRNEVNKRRK